MNLFYKAVSFLAPLATIFSAAHAQDGVDVGNGGNTISIDFVAHARIAVQLLDRQSDPFFSKVSPANYEEMLQRLRIEIVDNLPRNRDAQNYPDNEAPLVKLNQNAWERKSPEDKIALAFHEMLGLLGLERNTYQYTSKFKQLLTPVHFNAPITGNEKVLFSEGFDYSRRGLTADSAVRLCNYYKKVGEDKYFSVYCKYLHKKHARPWSRYSRFENYGLKVIGVGKLSSLPWKTIYNSLRPLETPEIKVTFSDRLAALQSCTALRLSYSNSEETMWKFAQSECEVRQTGSEYYFIIKTQNPTVEGIQ